MAYLLLFCFSFLLHLPQTQATFSKEHHTCLDGQKSTLLQFQQEMLNTYYSSSWQPDTDCCLWSGVKCNMTTGYVIGLELNFNGLIYSNSSLFLLNHLQRLSLASSNFGLTSIPSGFGKLSSLTYLNLSHTCFSGQIPLEFSRLTRLVSLDLSIQKGFCTSNPQFLVENRTKLETPNLKALIQSMPSLTELYLDEVDLSAQGSDWSQFLAQSLPNLRVLSLSNCNLSGPIHSSFSQLVFLSELRLDENYLFVEAPKFLPNFLDLKILSLRSCGLYGEFPTSVFQQSNLQILDVSNNSLLTGQLPDSIGNLRSLVTLQLSRCDFSGSVSPSLANLTQLAFLDLSFNSFTGSFPLFKSISQISKLEYVFLGTNNFIGTVNLDMFGNLQSLKILDLSDNQLSLEAGKTSSTLPQLRGLLLGSCHLKEFPNLLRIQDKLEKLDLSNNQIQGHIPSWIWKETLTFVDLSYNNLSGLIPESICKLSSLQIFLASYNNLSGSIPECLGNIGTLSILNLEGNRFHGMPQHFISASSLKTLDLNGNILEGQLPMSLANCKSLEILDLGNNKICDTFPFWLEELPMLQVLILRSNRFFGTIKPPQNFTEFPMLEVIDLSSNRFTGNLPTNYFQSLRAMMSKKGYKSGLKFNSTDVPYYKELVTRLGMEYFSISTIYKILDLSNNRFQGEIPKLIGDLTSLVVLNLSRNDLTGQIPSLIGSMAELEALDLSCNRLYGLIPQKLTKLPFLEVLNFSQNYLEGPIPQGNQFDTFTNKSYSENPGLCGLPLSRKCRYVAEEIVCGTVIGIIVPSEI